MLLLKFIKINTLFTTYFIREFTVEQVKVLKKINSSHTVVCVVAWILAFASSLHNTFLKTRQMWRIITKHNFSKNVHNYCIIIIELFWMFWFLNFHVFKKYDNIQIQYSFHISYVYIYISIYHMSIYIYIKSPYYINVLLSSMKFLFKNYFYISKTFLY